MSAGLGELRGVQGAQGYPFMACLTVMVYKNTRHALGTAPDGQRVSQAFDQLHVPERE